MLSTKDLYMKACHESKELHEMTEEERQKLQAHLRRMYVELEKVCDRHGLRIMVAYGSVLGALRHKGFIPWDDDMDLLMPREDYDKLIQEYADELPKEFRIYAPNSKYGPKYRFAKVVDITTRFLGPGEEDVPKNGIFLDIFPLENAPTNQFVVKIRRLWTLFLMLVASAVDEYTSNNRFYKRLMYSSLSGKRTYRIRNFIGWLFSWRSTEGWYNNIDKFTKYHKETGYYCVPVGAANLKYFMPIAQDIFLPVKRLPFDDITVYVPNQSEKHCEMEYGNWKWIPPVDQRWQHFIENIKFNEEND